MPYKNKEDRAIRDKERYVKNRGYKKANHKGWLCEIRDGERLSNY